MSMPVPLPSPDPMPLPNPMPEPGPGRPDEQPITIIDPAPDEPTPRMPLQ